MNKFKLGQNVIYKDYIEYCIYMVVSVNDHINSNYSYSLRLVHNEQNMISKDRTNVDEDNIYGESGILYAKLLEYENNNHSLNLLNLERMIDVLRGDLTEANSNESN